MLLIIKKSRKKSRASVPLSVAKQCNKQIGSTSHHVQENYVMPVSFQLAYFLICLTGTKINFSLAVFAVDSAYVLLCLYADRLSDKPKASLVML